MALLARKGPRDLQCLLFPSFALMAAQDKQVSGIRRPLASGHWFLARSKKREASDQNADT